MGKPKYFVIANVETSKDLPYPEKEYLHPYPNENSTEYIWKKGLVGAAGFYYEQAKDAVLHCRPQGEMISMNTIAKNVIKE